jgi:hypothetical protein
MQIAMLLASDSNSALRQSLCAHLLRCDRCREIFAAAVKSDRQATSTLGTAGDRVEVTVGPDSELVRDILDGFRNSAEAIVGRDPSRCIIPMFFSRPEGESALLAANEPTDDASAVPLAVFHSNDNDYTVTFSQSGVTGGISAVVERSYEAAQPPISLAFPALDLVFPLDENGRTEIKQIEAALLGQCRVDIEV